MRKWTKFWSLNGKVKWLLCEASILLLLFNILVRNIAFKHIDGFLRRRWTDNIQNGDHEEDIRAIRWSLARAANLLPCDSLCLSRSIVEFIMLRRRGIPALMSAGARFSGPSSLEAHAWVDAGLKLNEGTSQHADFKPVIRIGTGTGL
jgi:hypothetical protein